jgi:hypothetical protein
LKSFETWRTWLIVIGLVLFSGIASLVFLSLDQGGGEAGFLSTFTDTFSWLPQLEVEGDSNGITIDLEQLLLGDVLVDLPLIQNLDGVTVNPLVLFGILGVIVVGAIAVASLPLALIFAAIGRQTVQVKESPEYQEERGALERREKERMKEINEAQPVEPMPAFERSIWTPISQGFAILLFVVLIGLALADTFYPDGQIPALNMPLVSAGTIVAGVLAVITVIALIIVYGQRHAFVRGEGDEASVPWGMIWVAISGLIFVGIGIGLMLVIRSGGGG